MKVLVTGAAGFIGFFTTLRLLERGDEVVGIDNLNDYYDVSLKEARLAEIGQAPGADRFNFIRMDLADYDAVADLFAREGFEAVINLAAQAGVRYSLENPHAYADSNLVGFLNVLEGCRHNGVGHLVFASSSSVYGLNQTMPFSVHDNVDHPVSLYAASKKANELMAHTYAHLYGIASTGLRFFTVYGPWGRPDMSPIKFAQAIVEGRPIDVFNYGNHQRDFTYIDDIVEGVLRVLDRPPPGNPEWNGKDPDPGASVAPWRVYNIGNQEPVELMDYIATLERHLGREAKKNMLPLQPGDVIATYADVADLVRDTGYAPRTSLDDGIGRFVHWFKGYYGVA